MSWFTILWCHSQSTACTTTVMPILANMVLVQKILTVFYEYSNYSLYGVSTSKPTWAWRTWQTLWRVPTPLAGPVMDRPYQGTCRAQRSWVSGLRNVCSSQNLQLHNWAVIRTGKTVQNSQSSRSELNEDTLNVAMSLSWSLKANGIDER